MRIVVTGASGNVGTSVVAALGRDPRVEEIVGLARRLPRLTFPRTRWVQADIVTSRLTDFFRDADAVIHLAWLIQPSRDERTLEAVNVTGSRRVFEAAAEAGVGALVHASSIGAYSAGPSDRPVDESWPTGGTPSLFYARHKAAAERALDAMETAHPELRVVRLRPALIFKREAASEIRPLFPGPFLPSPLVRPGLLPVLPLPAGLVVQAVHADDVAEAYRLPPPDQRPRRAHHQGRTRPRRLHRGRRSGAGRRHARPRARRPAGARPGPGRPRRGRPQLAGAAGGGPAGMARHGHGGARHGDAAYPRGAPVVPPPRGGRRAARAAR